MSMVEWRVEDGIGWLTFARPDVLNALSAEMMNDASTLLRRAEDDPLVRVVVIGGAGRAFSSGADLGDAEDPGATTDPSKLDAASDLVLAIRGLPKPVIASVNGLAAGVGCSIAFACDLVHAAGSAYFLLAFTKVGLMPDGGATLSLPLAVGSARAFELICQGERLDAVTACEWGLVNAVHDDGELTSRVASIAAVLAAGPPLAYARTKAAINQARWQPLGEHLELERSGQLELMASADFAEAVRAFAQRRQPKFTGR